MKFEKNNLAKDLIGKVVSYVFVALKKAGFQAKVVRSNGQSQNVIDLTVNKPIVDIDVKDGIVYKITFRQKDV